jgi:hypothetical protein
MKQLILSLLLFISFSCFSQVLKPQLVGVWDLTNANNPKHFTDTWELTENDVFNELKWCCEASKTDSLIADENGSWVIKNDTLIITVTNEMQGGKKTIYPKPQIMKLFIKKENSYFLLYPFKNGKKEEIVLKLEKRK